MREIRDTVRQAGGYILNVAESRRPKLLDARDSGDDVAESVPDFKHPRGYPLICFVSFRDGAITHLAEGRCGHRAGTDLRRLNLVNLNRVGTPVPYRAVLRKLPPHFRSHVETRCIDGGLLPHGSFGAFVDAVRDVLPEANRLLERFSESRRRLIAELKTEARVALAYQKETVATALTFAGLDREELGDWQPRVKNGQVGSFLDGLSSAYLREDQMIVNDLGIFPGLEAVHRMKHTSVVFSGHRVRLTVTMAHRNRLEEQLGADLVYCNETYESFVVVQYKAMEHDGRAAAFRLPNDQLDRELKRMEGLWARFQGSQQDADLDDFRLKENPLFLKLCPRMTFDPDDAGLVKGMYIPLEYWRRLERTSAIQGRREGKLVTFENVRRYFDNTSFAQLVASG